MTNIGNNAFYGCSNLALFTIPNNVTSIGNYVFYNCVSLASITIGNSITNIGGYAFFGCTSLTSISIPNSLTIIGESAFKGCTNLAKVNISDISSWCKISFSDSYSNPLYYAQNLYLNDEKITELTIPNNVTSVGSYTFSGCSGLTSVTIPSNVTNIGKNAFSGCTNLLSVNINSNEILSKQYTSSSSLKDVFGNQVKIYILGEDVKNIGSYAFYKCASMTSINIPSSLISIGNNVFNGCTGLTSINIPKSVTNIENSAFKGCSNLSKVNISDISAWCNITFGDIDSNPLNYAHNLYINGEILSNFIIPNDVTSVGNYAFYGCTNLESVTISNSVESIGNKAFYGCSNLLSVTLNSKTILSKPYASSSSLKDIFGNQVINYIIGNEVTSIGSYAFYDCSDLISITIGNNVTNIGNNAFYGCAKLTKVNTLDIAAWCGILFDNSSSNPLYYARNLYLNDELITNIVIPNNVTSIGNFTFNRCTNLESVTIPISVSNIGKYAFSDCSGLTSVAIGNGVTSIEENAFSSCSNMTSINIPVNVTSIGGNAFENCTKLSKVKISDISAWCSIKFGNLKANPLYYAHKLYLNDEIIVNLIIPNNVKSIGEYVFSNCTSLESVIIHNSIKNIGNDAFNGCYTNIYDMHTIKDFYVGTGCYKTNEVYTFSYVWQSVTGGVYHPYDVPKVNIYSNAIKLESVELQNYDDVVLSYEFLGIDSETNSSHYCSENTDHILYYFFHTAKGDDIKGMYKFRTPTTKLTTLEPKVVNKGEVIVAAETNLIDDSPNAGFEWRKIDAPEVISSKTGEAVVYDGRMEDIIKNLESSSFYKYRAYYKTINGSVKYGEWVGFDPSDFSYFEPTVHTYDYVEVVNGTATFVGNAMQGSDEITSQGFEYWKDDTSHSNGLFIPSSANSDINTVTATGQRMTAHVDGLASGTTYGYRAFVKTSKGTKYGEVYKFTMPITNGIETITDPQPSFVRKGVYNLSGVKIANSLPETGKLPSGIYIVDGKKIVVK